MHSVSRILKGSSVLAIVLTVVPAQRAYSQSLLADPPNVASGGGATATASYTPGNIEAVNSVNGNMMLSIRAASLPPGPGGFSSGVSLVYNSTIYDAKTEIPTNKASVLRMYYVPSAHGGGWNYSYKYTLWSQTRVSVFNSVTCAAVTTTQAKNWYKTLLTTPDGTDHVLRLVSSQPASSNLSTDSTTGYAIYDFAGYTNLNCSLAEAQFRGTLIFASADGSNIRVEANTITLTWTAFFPDGTRVSGPIALTNQPHATDSDATQIMDRNGNTISITGNCTIGNACTETIQDAQGRNIVLTYTSRSSGGWTDTITAPGPNGRTTTSVAWTTTSPSTLPYYCQASADGAADTTYSCSVGQGFSQQPAAVQSVTLPAAQSGGSSTIFKFVYTVSNSAYTWGEIRSASMCTGASVSTCTEHWKTEYAYKFDNLNSLPTSASPDRPPGTTLNPIASKTLTYTEPISGTSQTETTTYTMPTPSNFATYPVITPLNGSQITFPDGSYQLVYTTNLCSESVKARDLCPAIPIKLVKRDGTVVEYKWATNQAPAGTPAGAQFNPYVQYTIEKPYDSSHRRISYFERDVNGNPTVITQYHWAAASAVVYETNTGRITTVCASGCTAANSKSFTYYNATAYWNTTAPSVLRAPQTIINEGITTSFSFDNALTTANLTQIQRAGVVSQSATYLANGNVKSQNDANGTRTLICYDTNNLYPTKQIVGATNGATCDAPSATSEGRTTTFEFDSASGIQTKETDADNAVVTSMVYDNLGRVTSVTQTAGTLTRKTDTDFDDANRLITTTNDDIGSNRLVSKAYFDPLGRPYQSIDPSGKIIRKAYRYGSGGQTYELVSNPYTSTTDSTMGWSLTTSDVPTPSNSPVKTVTKFYSGSTLPAPWGNNTTLTGTASTALTVSSCVGAGTIVTDAALNATTYCSDALGRLSGVIEADSTTTTYSYDGRGNLTAANIAGQVRAFEYDSLDRLLKACNPETSTANCTASPLGATGLERFTYDNNGNVLTRTDARGVVTTLTGYDALNRPSSKSYTTSGDVDTTASVTWTYDTHYKGMLSSVTSDGLITGYTYDAFGRVNASTQTTGGKSYSFAYEYSSADRLLSIQYPSGRKISYGYDNSGRLSSVKNYGATSSYASIDYSATNGIPTMSFGNGIVETTSWNDRFQMTGLSAAKAGASAALTLGFYYCPGLAVSCTSGNNGMLRSQSIAGGSLSATQTYTYDAVNKIKDASESGNVTWLETYRYNNTNGTVGNIWVEPDSPLRAGLPKLSNETAQGISWYTGRNQLNQWGVDNSGNITGVHSMLRTFKYDAENRQTSATIDDVKTTYRYDGLGQRVQKIAGTTTTTYVYDAGGNLAAEYSTAIVASGCGTAVCYVTTDHLGSTRLLTDASGNPAKRYDYSPFGVELFVGTGGRSVNDGYTSSTDGFNPKFTGQMRDSETGLDFFNARYYSPAQGRFQSPDPGNAGADLANPQTWNMYAYVNNSPLNYTDPTGQFIAVGVGAAVGGPPGAAIGGIATGLGALFRWIFGGGGGNHGELAPLADVLSRSVDVSGLSGGWWSNCGFLFGTVCGIGPSDELLPTFYAEAIGDMPVPGQGKATKPVAGTTGSYTSLDCAGYQAATAFLPQTNKTGLEHGGYIYKGSRGTFSYSAPIVGTPTSIPSFYTALSKPNGVSIAGWYHTHPLVPGYTNEAFSGYDLGVSRKLNVPGYLGAASGRVLKLTPKGVGITTRVGTGACRVN